MGDGYLESQRVDTEAAEPLERSFRGFDGGERPIGTPQGRSASGDSAQIPSEEGLYIASSVWRGRRKPSRPIVFEGEHLLWGGEAVLRFRLKLIK